MDPEANLKEQRDLRLEIITQIEQGEQSDELTNAVLRLCELNAALDEWLTAGGFLPDDWKGGHHEF